MLLHIFSFQNNQKEMEAIENTDHQFGQQQQKTEKWKSCRFQDSPLSSQHQFDNFKIQEEQSSLDYWWKPKWNIKS